MSPTSEDLVKFLRRLRAVKEYTPEPVTQAQINDILEIGRWTGSGSNRQPWEVVVIRDPEVQRKFGEWGARPSETAAVVFLIVSNSDNNAFDEGRLAERLLLGAAAHGLGGTVATLKNEGPAAAKELLGIPQERRAFTTVNIGHTDIAARRARPANPNPRKPVTEFAHFDRF
jgi:nitroreductase